MLRDLPLLLVQIFIRYCCNSKGGTNIERAGMMMHGKDFDVGALDN
jgi:hypothetical protein